MNAAIAWYTGRMMRSIAVLAVLLVACSGGADETTCTEPTDAGFDADADAGKCYTCETWEDNSCWLHTCLPLEWFKFCTVLDMQLALEVEECVGGARDAGVSEACGDEMRHCRIGWRPEDGG